MRTYDFRNFFLMFLSLRPGAPTIHSYRVDELDGECRSSTAIFVRLWPLTVAVGFGRWHMTGRTPADTFRQLFSSREIPLTGEVRDYVRATVAAHAKDADEEWTFLEMLELDQ